MATEVSFEPTCIHIRMPQGDSHIIPVEVEDTETPPAAINITGGVFTMSVNPEPDGGVADLFTVSGIITDGPNGLVSFQPTTTDNEQPLGTYYYDIQMVLTGETKTIMYGEYTITKEIT